MKIRFMRLDAALAFASMAESMWENAVERDPQWTAFIRALNNALPGESSRWTEIDLPEEHREMVLLVRENCADSARDVGLDDAEAVAKNPEDAALSCCPWEIIIEGEPHP